MVKDIRFALAAAIGVGMASPALADNLVFTLSNQSASDLTEFYASAKSAANWEENILSGGVLAAGTSGEVTISSADGNCDYDLRMVFADGDALEQSANLCDIGVYTIN